MTEIIKETDQYIIYVRTKFWANDSGETKEYKFLCVGGPFGGIKMTITQLYEAGDWYDNSGKCYDIADNYVNFNRAHSYHQKYGIPTMVRIWKGYLTSAG